MVDFTLPGHVFGHRREDVLYFRSLWIHHRANGVGAVSRDQPAHIGRDRLALLIRQSLGLVGRYEDDPEGASANTLTGRPRRTLLDSRRRTQTSSPQPRQAGEIPKSIRRQGGVSLRRMRRIMRSRRLDRSGQLFLLVKLVSSCHVHLPKNGLL